MRYTATYGNRPKTGITIKTTSGAASGGLCGCWTIIMLFNIFVGGFLFDYCLWSLFGKNIHWFGDIVCGLFTAELCVPIAIVSFILRLCGIEAPFFQ